MVTNFGTTCFLFLLKDEWKSFKDLCVKIDNFKINDHKLHTAVRYGISQAILDVFSKHYRKTMTEIIREEYNLNFDIKRIPILLNQETIVILVWTK